MYARESVFQRFRTQSMDTQNGDLFQKRIRTPELQIRGMKQELRVIFRISFSRRISGPEQSRR
ncbi:MAG: hypothetical protein IKC53_02690, partial [Lentisphaeria bacterium]|nr:hypothetical protein [Lentisphaeria bacterium]